MQRAFFWYDVVVIFDELQLWIDPVKRPGPEAMAVDEWLLGVAKTPVLRVYGWLGEWGSVGYFGKLGEANSMFPGIHWVRRWTGGGTVDHRDDWTYTVVAPGGEALAKARGAASYQRIHAALAKVLTSEGIDARLSHGEEETGATLCFENPVNHDLIDSAGRKLAGAGQRRSRSGLLHQGSVALACPPEISTARAKALASCLAKNHTISCFLPPENLINHKISQRYAHPDWTERR